MSSHHTMLLLAYTVMILLIAYRLADTYLGGAYVCPRCGAREAGRNLWVARLEPRGRWRTLTLVALDRMEKLCGTAARAEVLARLVRLVQESEAALWGCDFPFGMPLELFPAGSPWHDQFAFLAGWGEQAYACGLECIRRARLVGGRMHIRRTTDDDARAPFDAYHYRSS